MNHHQVTVEPNIDGTHTASTRLPCGKLVLVEEETYVNALGGMIHHLQELNDKKVLSHVFPSI